MSKDMKSPAQPGKLTSNTKSKIESMRHISPIKNPFNPSALMTSGRSGSIYGASNVSKSASVSKMSKSRFAASKRTQLARNVEPSSVITQAQIKKDVISAFKKIKLDAYTDILRIKQPQKVAYQTGSILCKIVNSFRGGSQKSNSDPIFTDWS
jgi:hypothetical protein